MVKYQLEVSSLGFANLRVLVNAELKELRRVLLNNYDKEISMLIKNNIIEMEDIMKALDNSKLIL